jgi:hypothetical protein
MPFTRRCRRLWIRSKPVGENDRKGGKTNIAVLRVWPHTSNMDSDRLRGELVVRLLIAHFLGLTVVGFVGTIGTTTGFGHDAMIGAYAGLIMSAPLILVAGLVVWFFADFIDRHVLLFCLAGPLIVIGFWWFVDDVGGFLEFVAISSITSSVCFLTATLWRKRKRSMESK